MTGTSKAGPFTLTSQNRYVSQSDITWESAWQVADLAYLVSQVPGAEITGLAIDSAVTKDSSTYELTRLEQRIGGGWAVVGKGAPVLAKAGSALRMRGTLTDGSTTRTVPFQLAVPARTQGSMGRMYVTGGSTGDMVEDEGFYDFYYGRRAEDGRLDHEDARLADPQRRAVGHARPRDAPVLQGRPLRERPAGQGRQRGPAVKVLVVR